MPGGVPDRRVRDVVDERVEDLLEGQRAGHRGGQRMIERSISCRSCREPFDVHDAAVVVEALQKRVELAAADHLHGLKSRDRV